MRFGSFLIFLLPGLVWAAELERLGRFEISEFALSPRLHMQEPGLGGFELSQSWIGFEWTRDEMVRGVLKLGSLDLTKPSIWNSVEARPDFGVSEAWMEGRSLFGDVRAGLLSIPQTFEGASPDWSSILPETRARHDGWFIKRDFGLQFLWNTKPYETSITVHNGESGPNKDGQYWVTSHWQYKTPDGSGVMVAGSVGNTKPLSTSKSEANLPKYGFAFKPNEESKIRMGGVALFRAERRSLLLIEAGKGEILQQEEKNSFFWGHADAVLNWGGDLSLLARYEQTQSNQKDSDTTVKSSGAGMSFSSKDNLQSLTLFANHSDEAGSVPNDELWLIFRIHSFHSK